jgi:limonene-1,2-epoxide hydrolase
MGGCGGGGQKAPGGSAQGGSHLSDEQVIRGWSRALTDGDIATAADFFAVPSTVSNGTPAVRVTNSQLARAFNESLPCGARVLKTARRGPYTVATFRLEQRRGGDCAGGVGGEAATAFRIRGGKIVEWRRVAVPRAAPAPRAPDSSSSV